MMKCEIIRDLIPLYLDKVCSEDMSDTMMSTIDYHRRLDRNKYSE